ncbi:MAG: hypothetical protein HY002_08455 [Candidatus Rokubacteria bacterium]|nr:hypothetical protein [Candidatus Rokubacteria bacterium]
MRRVPRLLLLGCTVTLATGCFGHLFYASGPYRGKVVDAETGQPLVGAVVLAIWYREVPTAPHGPAVDYHDALEVLTDANGDFEIPAKTHFTPIGKIREPDFVVYYPGYAVYPSDRARPQGEQVDAAYARRLFRFELSEVKTREEWVRVGDPTGRTSKVPESRIPNLVRLVNKQRQDLGLQPIRLGR